MQGHFLRGTNIDPPSVTRKDSESSENTSPDKGNNSESEEDILLNGNVLSTDSSSSEDGYTAEQLFTVTRSTRTTTTYKRVDKFYWYTVWDVSFVNYIYVYFSMSWYLISASNFNELTFLHGCFLYICCIFAENFFRKTPMGHCF